MNEEYSFNGQRTDEKVLEVVLSHPYVLYPASLRSVILFTVALAVVLFFPSWYLLAIVFFLIGIFFLTRAIYCYRESLFIITDQRLFIINQTGFFRRKITEIDLYKILDITSQTDSFAKTILKFGDLLVRTAGAREDGGLIIKNIPDPYSVEQRIANLDGIHAHKKREMT